MKKNLGQEAFPHFLQELEYSMPGVLEVHLAHHTAVESLWMMLVLGANWEITVEQLLHWVVENS